MPTAVTMQPPAANRPPLAPASEVSSSSAGASTTREPAGFTPPLINLEVGDGDPQHAAKSSAPTQQQQPVVPPQPPQGGRPANVSPARGRGGGPSEAPVGVDPDAARSPMHLPPRSPSNHGSSATDHPSLQPITSMSLATRTAGTSASATFTTSAGLNSPQHGGQQNRLRPRPLLRRWFDGLVEDALSSRQRQQEGAGGGSSGVGARATLPLSPFDDAYENSLTSAPTIDDRAQHLVASLRRYLVVSVAPPPAVVGSLSTEDALAAPRCGSNSATASPSAGGGDGITTPSAISPSWRTRTVGPEELRCEGLPPPPEAAPLRHGDEHSLAASSSGLSIGFRSSDAATLSPSNAGGPRGIDDAERAELELLRRQTASLKAENAAVTTAVESLVLALLRADTTSGLRTAASTPHVNAALEAVEHRNQMFLHGGATLGGTASEGSGAFGAAMPEPSMGDLIPGVSGGNYRSASFSASTARGVPAAVAVRAVLAGLRGTLSPTNGTPESPLGTPSATAASASPAPGPVGALNAAALRRAQRATPAVNKSAAEGPLLQGNTAASGSYEPAAEDMFNESHASIRSLMHVAAAHTTVTANVNDSYADGTQELNQFVLLQLLGAGSQGEVFLAMDTDKNEMRAIKCVRRQGGAASGVPHGALAAARQRKRDMLEREVTVMKRCRHRNVVTLYEVIDDPTVDCMYLVMQYVEHGPLRTMQPGGLIIEPINPVKLAGYARQLCAGLEYLHRHGVIHRDIKPENILLGTDDEVFLADFGVADLFEGKATDGRDSDNSSAESPPVAGVSGTRGTLPFLAPELFQDNGGSSSPAAPVVVAATATHSGTDGTGEGGASSSASVVVKGEAVDVWALGVTLYVLLYGQLPWRYTSTRELVDAICYDEIVFPGSSGESPGVGGSDGSPDNQQPPPGHRGRRTTAVYDDSPQIVASEDGSPSGTGGRLEGADNHSSVSFHDPPGAGGPMSLPSPFIPPPGAADESGGPPRGRSRRTSSATQKPRSRSSSCLSLQASSSGKWLGESPSSGLGGSSMMNLSTAAAADTDLRAPWRSLLRGMLNRDPTARLTISQARARAMRMLRTASKHAEDAAATAPAPAAITRIVRRSSMGAMAAAAAVAAAQPAGSSN